MMRNKNFNLLAGLLLAVLAVGSAFGSTTIVSDNYTATTSGTGFGLGAGVNTGINPPTTRITGTAAANLRYLFTDTVTPKAASAYDINSNRLRVSTDSGIGRFSLSANGSVPFDFSPELGAYYATPANPATYDIKISMRNDATSTARFSFALSTAEGDATTWDFGLQVYRAASGNDYYTFAKRVDTGSCGLASDLNATMATAAAGTAATMVNFLIRVTDAGPESGANYNSRVQVSTNGGTSFFYDTSTDSALPNGFRFDGTGRYILFDQAANSSGPVYYDSFSITSTYAPPPPPQRIWTGAGTDANWSTVANWNGFVPVSGDPLVFDGTTQPINTNDLSGLSVSSVTFNTGGFTLFGSPFTDNIAISNLAGINILAADLAWDSTGVKNWSMASGSELILSNTTTIDVVGDHYLFGGGTLWQKGALNVGQASTANPAFFIYEGQHIVDGGTFISKGGYRIGSLATATAGAQTILTNGGVLNITATGGGIRVGDSADPVTTHLVIDHSTLMTGGATLYIPYAAGATGQVDQVGGTVTGCPIIFSYSGGGKGTYNISDGTLETTYIAEGGSGALSYIYFSNAVLRAVSGSTNAFMSGLNRAEIQSGGLTIDAQADIVIAQKLVGAGALTKTGPATLTLNGANTYTSNTIVNAGKLILPTGQTYAKTIQVADSAELGVTVGTQGASLTNGSLTLGNNGIVTLSFDLGPNSNPTAALIATTNLTANSIVSINVGNGLQLRTGPIVLVDYQGTIGGLGFDAFVLNNLPPGISAELVNDTTNNSIDLNITSAPGFLWNGDQSTAWDNGTPNWIDEITSLPTMYSDGLLTEFRDGAVTGVVDLAIFPYPSVIVVSNNLLPYVWTGGGITTPLLRKYGAGSVTRVESAPDSITTIDLREGTYAVSNVYDATFATILTNANPKTGTFLKQGLSTLTVTSTNSKYDGTVLVQEGTLKLGSDAALGSINGATTVANGATLNINHFTPGFEPVIVSGDGVNGQGAILDTTTSTAVTVALGDVTLAGDTTFGAPNGQGRWDIRVRSSTGAGPGLKGNGHKLTKVGTGFISIACQRNLGAATPYWRMNLGDILVSEGTLAFAESLDLGNPSASLAVYPGAKLQFYDLNITNPILRTITMTNAQISASGGSDDTNVLNGPIQMDGANTFWCDQAHLIINGAISGSASVVFYANDPGTLILNGINTYTGDTIVTNGTLGGNGVIAGNLIMMGGTNSPGMSVGTLTVNGNATLAGTTYMELNRSLAPNSDRLVVGGILAFGGTLTVVLAPGAPAPQAGDAYQLFNKGSGSAFSAISLPSLAGLPGGLAWDTSKLAVNGTLSVTGAVAPPTIGTASVNGGNFTFSGTGGVEGNSYHVVTSPDVAAPLASWLPVASNVFGPGGSFSFATNMAGGAPKAFFRLVVP